MIPQNVIVVLAQFRGILIGKLHSNLPDSMSLNSNTEDSPNNNHSPVNP